MPSVASSVISWAEYNAAARELHVVFTTGRTYLYHDVPADVYFQFLRSGSQGAFFNAMIRDRYRFTDQRTE